MNKKILKKNIFLLLAFMFATFTMFSCTNNTQVNTDTKNSTSEEGVLDNVYDVVESKFSADYENVTSDYQILAIVDNGFCCTTIKEAYEASYVTNPLKRKNVTVA